MKAFKVILDNLNLILRTSIDELKQRNAGSVLGHWWLMISPLILLGVYSFVYIVIFKLRPNNMDQPTYVLHIFSGLIPFLGLAEALSMGTMSLSNNRNLLKNTVFPIEIIPVKTVLTSLMNFCLGLMLVLFISLFFRFNPISIICIPIIIFFQSLFLVGVCWITSLVNLVFKDIQNILNYLIMVLMLSSPIAYTIDMVPPKLEALVWANPFSYFIISYQALIAHGKLPPTKVFIVMPVASILIFLLGYLFFNKMKVSVSNYA